jgi:hypothetical protein
VKSSTESAAESEAADNQIWFNDDETTAYSSEFWANRYRKWGQKSPHAFVCDKKLNSNKAHIIEAFNKIKTREQAKNFLIASCHTGNHFISGGKTKKKNKRKSRKTRRA